MKSLRCTSITALIVFVLIQVSTVLSQDALGPLMLVDQPAPTIKDPMKLTRGLKSHSFLTRVGGGVAFEAIAAPASGVAPSSLALGYDDEGKNGQRVWVELDGDRVVLPLYDWQLGPLARFANSPYASCVTLFGELDDASYLETLGDRETHVINYHPAFVNTLLGLRLFQLDILIMDNAAVELPKRNGRYILGAGEQEPDIDASTEAGNAFVRATEHLQDDAGMLYRSYVICDYGQSVEFAPSAGKLTLTGSPFFYCWRFNSDATSYDERQSRKRIAEELEDDMREAGTSAGGASHERTFIIEALLDQLEQYDGTYSLFENGPFVEMLALSTRAERAQYAEEYTTESLHDVLIELMTAMDASSPVYLEEVSEAISSRSTLLHGINPAVWDAGVVTMRTAAFFRYCRQHHSEEWTSFYNHVRDLGDGASVVTPTVMYRE